MPHPFKLKFSLTQHTPIIHFQHDQVGATLRATEVKPKLDRFLIKNFKKNGIDYKRFISDESVDKNPPLDYKIKIKSTNIKVTEIPTRSPLFFGNMGDANREKPKKYCISKKPVIIEILCLHKELLNQINLQIPVFFAISNFGTRQNKGFGSFFISESDNSSFLNILKTEVNTFIYFKTDSFAEKLNPQQLERLFSKIGIIYSLLKTGVNFPNHPTIYNNGRKSLDSSKKGKFSLYFKSYLFQYLIQDYAKKGIKVGSEKRFIKEKFFHPKVRIDNDGSAKKYMRALLGVSGSVEFKDKERRGKIEYNGGNIERFKSPITIKIVNNHVVFIPDDENLKKIFNHQFKFDDNRNHNNVKNITTPESIDLDDLLTEFAGYFNNLKTTINDISNTNEKVPTPYSNIVTALKSIVFKKYKKTENQA